MRISNPVNSSLSIANRNNISKAINALRNINFDTKIFSVIKNACGIFVTLRQDATTTDESATTDEPWDYLSTNVAVVTLVSGEIELHSRNNLDYYPIDPAQVTLQNGQNWIYAELSDLTGTPTPKIDRTATQAGVVSTGNIFRELLWRIDYVAATETASLVKRYHRGNVKFFLDFPLGGTKYQSVTKSSNDDSDYAWDWIRAHG